MNKVIKLVEQSMTVDGQCFLCAGDSVLSIYFNGIPYFKDRKIARSNRKLTYPSNIYLEMEMDSAFSLIICNLTLYRHFIAST